jgi:hypothetical protein
MSQVHHKPRWRVLFIRRNARCEGEEGRVEFGLAFNEKRHDPAAAGTTEKRLAGGIRPDRDRGIQPAGDSRHAGRGGSCGAACQRAIPGFMSFQPGWGMRIPVLTVTA